MKWETVIGLETHVELSTKTKIFCSCKTDFGGDPNTHCCPICIGLPGTLPKINKKAIRYAVMAGLATNCTINNISKMDRKNYVYPDLPKAYQISQFDKPLCSNGHIELSNGKKVRINRIHLEEDAGKLVHESGNVYIDYNRGGVPLIEIVTEPDISNELEAKEYVEKLQMIMRNIGVSDCKMQEGSMRCDVNLSVRESGSKELGVKTEIKNMNSVTFMTKAIEYERERQIDLLESGQKVIQETLRFDESTGATSSMRRKEDAHDYRYFKDPDLVEIHLTDEEIENIKSSLPESPDVKLSRYINDLGIKETDASILIKYRNISIFFDEAVKGVKNPQTVSNFIIGQLFRSLDGDNDKEKFDIKVTPEELKELVLLIEDNKISMNIAKATLDKMLENGKPVKELISDKDMQEIDKDALNKMCQEAIASNENAVADYKSGKEKALKSILGFVMKLSKGRANALEVEEILKGLLK